MPDHLHLLCGTNDKEISVLDFVNQYKGKSTRVGWRYNIKGPLWQRKSYDHILRREENIQEVATYIVNNPVRSGLVEKWDQYPYSEFLDNFDL
jgi:REP element-mobilizing transposase RayT